MTNHDRRERWQQEEGFLRKALKTGAALLFPALLWAAGPEAPQACKACHAETLNHTAHQIASVTCEACHGPSAAHVEKQDGKGMRSFKTASAQEANEACLACHKDGRFHGWKGSFHERKGLKCADCHNVHKARPMLPTRAELNDACTRCHAKQMSQGRLPFHHPVAENKMTCVDCHDPHGGAARNGLKAESVNQLCFQCHGEYEGPYTYQHPPVVENCLTCHAVHGSMNRRLLNVSQPALCLQCHDGHHNGTNIPLLNPCSACHSSIHGSDIPSATGGSVFIDKGVR